jgi:hypothetical protein
LGSFETWGTWVRDPLLALGCQDPVAQIREIKARDPHRWKVAELYELWWEHHGDAPTKASELADEVKAAIDPQSRGRQFIAKAVEDLAGTRQSGFVLTRQKGEGRKAVATYALKKVSVSTQGDGLGSHPPHPPHPPHSTAGAETSAESTPATGEQNGDALGMPWGMPQPSTEHTQGITADGDTKIAAKTIASGKAEGMRGMGSMPSDLEEPAARGIPANGAPEVCAQCGAAEPGPLLHVLVAEGVVRLHKECRRFWLREHPQPRGAVIACVHITELPATGTLQ